jgi:acetoin utilization deacetylase AcuC-like enzyme
MAVTERGFSRMAAQMLELARKHAGGRIAFLLEGGYNLRALRESVGAVLGQMQRITASEDSAGGDRIQPLVREVVAVQQRYRRIARSI